MAGYYVSTSLTNDIDALLKEVYESRVMELVMVEQRILSRFPKKTVDGGRRVLQGVEMSWAGGAMGLPENATLPAPTASIAKDMIISPVMYAQRMQISQHAISQGRGSGALKDALTRGTNNLVKGFSKGFAHDTWGIVGSYKGARAIVGATATDTAQNLRFHGTSGTKEEADACTPGNRNLIDGMNIYWNTADNIAAEIATPGTLTYDVTKCGTVSSRGTTRESLTLSASKTMTADDVVVVWNGQTGSDFAIGCGSALTPIVEHVYDGTGTYQGLSRTTYPQLKSYVKGNTPSYAAGTNDLTEIDMLLCYQTPDERNGSTPNLLIGSYGVQRAYWNTLENLRRFPSIVSEGGNLNSLTFSGMKIVIDPDCPPGSIWFLDTSSFKWHQWKEMGWFDTDGRIMVRVSGKTELEGTYIAFTQLACENPAANACLRDITTTENNISY